MLRFLQPLMLLSLAGNADAPVHDSLVVCESQAKEVLMN